MNTNEIEDEIIKIATKKYDLPTPNESQCSFMRTCNKCKNRKRFKMEIKGKITEHDWCDEIYSYVKPNTLYLMCPYNKPHLNKRKPILDRLCAWVKTF